MSPTNPLREALERIAAPPDFWRIGKASQVAREALAAVPAEPEAWEWHAGYLTWGSGPRATKEEAITACEHFRGRAPDWIERRRPGTAPGPWERVDPEPRQEASGDELS